MGNSIRKNFTYQFIWQLMTILTPLITTPYLARVLGPEQVGVYAYTNSVTQYFVMFAILGMSSYGVRLISGCGNDRAERTKAFWQAYYVQLIAGLISLTVFAIYVVSGARGGIAVNALWSMYVLSACIDASWLLFGCQEFRIPTIRSILVNVFSLVVIFGFVRQPSDLCVYVAAIAGAFLLDQLLIWPFVNRYVGFERPRLSLMRRHLKGNLRLFIPVIAISLYTYLAKVLLGSMAGMEQSGFYDYSQKLSTVPISLITAVGTVMLPRMTAELSSGRRDEAQSLLDTSIWVMLILAFGLTAGISAIAPEFVPVYLGEGYESCVTLMAILSLTIPLITTTNVFGRQWLLPSYRDGYYTLSVVAGACVSVALNFVLIPFLGAIGSAWATVCAEATVLAVQTACVRKELPLRKYLLDAIPYIVIAILEYATVRCVGFFLVPICGTSVVTLLLEILAGALFYGAMCLLFVLVREDGRIVSVLGSKCPSFLRRR